MTSENGSVWVANFAWRGHRDPMEDYLEELRDRRPHGIPLNLARAPNKAERDRLEGQANDDLRLHETSKKYDEEVARNPNGRRGRPRKQQSQEELEERL